MNEINVLLPTLNFQKKSNFLQVQVRLTNFIHFIHIEYIKTYTIHGIYKIYSFILNNKVIFKSFTVYKKYSS